MYLQCKQGFIEADRWDGAAIPVPSHQKLVQRLAVRRPDQFVVVLRSREIATLQILVSRVVAKHEARIFESPKGWDYQFRAYVTSAEWAAIMSTIAGDLDYRNFKSWCTANKPQDHRLAHDIWHAAHDAGMRIQAPIKSDRRVARPLRGPAFGPGDERYWWGDK